MRHHRVKGSGSSSDPYELDELEQETRMKVRRGKQAATRGRLRRVGRIALGTRAERGESPSSHHDKGVQVPPSDSELEYADPPESSPAPFTPLSPAPRPVRPSPFIAIREEEAREEERIRRLSPKSKLEDYMRRQGDLPWPDYS